MSEKKEEQKAIIGRKISTVMALNTGLIIILILAIVFIKFADSKKSKIVFNGKELPQELLSMIQKKDNVEYIILDDFIEKTNTKMYSLYNDVFSEDKNKKHEEDSKSFYINSIYEAVQFNNKSDTYTKYIKYDYLDRKLTAEGGIELTKEEEQKQEKEPKKRELTKMDNIILNQEQFKLKHPIEEFNGKTALSLEDAKYAFNVRFDKSKDNRILKIYTIDFLEQQAARSLGKYSIDSNYQNRRSIVDGYVFVADNQSKERGVFHVNGGALSDNVIPIKYDEIRYAQNNNNVYCMKDALIELKNLENGKTIINAGEYASISVYSQDKQLYLVSDRSKKYGLVGIDGKIVIPTDFDIIGYDTSFYPGESEDAGKILFGNLIPVFKDNRWGFYYADSNKEVLIGQKLIGLGCKKMEYIESRDNQSDKEEIELPKETVENLAKIGFKLPGNKIDRQVALIRGFTTNRSDLEQGESVFTIPESAKNGYSGVVVRTEEGLYGIISSNAKKTGEFVLPPNFDRIYMLVQNGEAKYYAQSGSSTVELNRPVANESPKMNTETTTPVRKNTAKPITEENNQQQTNQNQNQNQNQQTNTNDNITSGNSVNNGNNTNNPNNANNANNPNNQNNANNITSGNAGNNMNNRGGVNITTAGN